MLALGAHPDDIEIGCAGTLLKLIEQEALDEACWVVLSGKGERADEARVSAEALLDGVPHSQVLVRDFPDGFFPYEGQRIKDFFEELKADFSPDLVFTHQRADLHQDHRLCCELSWNTFRDHLILEYEVPKYDGDMSAPNAFVPLEERLQRRKVDHLMEHFGTQNSKRWFTRGPLLEPAAVARHGVQLAQLLRRGVLLPQGRTGVTMAVRAAARGREAIGHEALELMQRLYPFCRSLTGDGVRATFRALEDLIPIKQTEIPSGTRVFDWIVPDEWNLRDAYIADAAGTRVVDFRDSTLHVVSYSEPVRTTLPLEALRERLHTLPDQPDLIPYRTSYYERTWGFCLSYRQLLELQPGDYEVVIDSTLEPGHLSYAELTIEGEGEEEVLISTYVCHPSLANDNLSGIAVAAMLAKQLLERELTPHLPLPVRSRHDRAARLAPPEPRRSRPHPARAHLLVHRRRRRPHLQAQPAGDRRGRPSDGDGAAGLGRTPPGASLGAVGRRRAPVLLTGVRPVRRLPHAHPARRVRRLPHVRRQSWSGSGPSRSRRRSTRASSWWRCSRATAASRT